MMRYRVSLKELVNLESSYVDLTERLEATLALLKGMRADMRHLRADIRNGETTDQAWLTQFDAHCKEAWESCRDLNADLTVKLQDIRNRKPGLTGPVVEAIKSANELVLADNACTLGRAGCEQRWDRAMEDLRLKLRELKDIE